MFYLIYFTNYPEIHGIYCTSGFRSNPEEIKNELCKADVEHCLITLSRKSVQDTFQQYSLGCWPWPELANQCPEMDNVCQILHSSEDNLHITCCCRGDMCNNRTVKIVQSKNKINHVYEDDLAKFGVQIPADQSDSMQLAQIPSNLDQKFNSRTDIFRNHHGTTIQIRTLPIFIVCGILLSALFTLSILFFCISSSRYENMRGKFFPSCNHSSISSSSYFHTTFTNSTRSTLKFLDCLNCHRNSIFKQTFTTNDVTSYPPLETVPDISHQSHSSDEKLHRGSCSESTGSEFIFADSFESGSVSTEVTHMQLMAKLCNKEQLLGRGRFGEVWLANLPVNLLNTNYKLTNGNLCRNLKSTPSNHELSDLDGINSQNNSNCDSAWHLLCCQYTNPILKTTTSKNNLNLPKKLFLESHPISLDYFHRDRTNDKTELTTQLTEQIKKENSNLFLQNDEILSLVDTSSPLLSPAKFELININSFTNQTNQMEYENNIPVAVKSFSPIEFNAWKTELGIFRTIHSVNKRLISISSQFNLNNVSNIYHNLKQIGHPNIVLLLGAGSVQNCESSIIEYRLVMEYASNGSLRKLFSNGTWLTLQEMLRICEDIANGLRFLHNEVIEKQSDYRFVSTKYPIAHRDLKPENILIRHDNSACLSDFGQSVCLMENSSGSPLSTSSCQTSLQDVLTTTYSISSALETMPKAGTLRYQAPEILDGAISFTGSALLRTDIYSLGLILWELMTTINVSNYDKSTSTTSWNFSNLIEPMHKSIKSNTIEENSEEGLFDHLEINHEEINKNSECKNTHKRHHWLPYEKELSSFCNSPTALQQLVSVQNFRPRSHSSWCNSPLLNQLYRTVNECWDPDPEARLTADCVLERIRLLKAMLDRSKNLSK